MRARISAAPCASARQDVLLQAGTLARELYGRDLIAERHRHRYEFNNNYLDAYTRAGMRFSGFSATDWSRSSSCRATRGSWPRSFIRNSPPRRATAIPLFTGFVRAARAYRASQLPAAAGA